MYTGNNNFASVGELVQVVGYARERFNQTALNGSNSNSSAVPAANIINCGSGSMTPVDVSMPFESQTTPERYEGMLVKFPQALKFLLLLYHLIPKVSSDLLSRTVITERADLYRRYVPVWRLQLFYRKEALSF